MRNKFCTFALTGFLTLGLAGSAAFAQDESATPPPQSTTTMHHQHRAMNSDRELKRMTKKLDLSADQQSQIKPILDSRQQQMDQLKQDQSTPKAERHQKMMAIQQDTNEKIEAVLNDTQKQKYESMESNMKGHRMHHNNQQQTPQESTPETPQSPESPQ